jgi:hypothetical protein
MMVATVSDRRPELGALILDVAITEEVHLEADVTQFWVEDGTVISDHVTQGPKNLRIIGVIATVDVGSFSFDEGGEPKVIDVMETLDRMHAERALVTISTGQMQYTDMAFTSLTATRTASAEGGNWLSINAEARKVRKVGLKTAEVPAENVRSTDAAKGRAGQTNKAAGKNSSNAAGSGAGREQFGHPDPGQSVLKGPTGDVLRRFLTPQ